MLHAASLRLFVIQRSKATKDLEKRQWMHTCGCPEILRYALDDN